VSALEEIPEDEVEIENPAFDEEREDAGEMPALVPFSSETAAEAVKERERQKSKRKQSMSSRIREMVGDDPARLANLLFDVAENVSGKERTADRIKATTELMDRGWGTAPSYAPIEGHDPLEASELDLAIRDIADQLIARRAHPTLDAKLIKREIDEGVRPPEAA
jgi:seryl-tRNA(Sec) selenium transferase